MKVSQHSIVLLLICIIFCLFLQPIEAYILTITPRAQECFYEELQPKERMMTTFEVVSGGMLDINVRVNGPDGKIVYEQEREKEGSFQFFALEKGAYQVCFSNAMSTMTSKMISFNIYAGHDMHRVHTAKVDHIQPLDRAVMALTENARKLSDSYNYIRTRLLTCHATTESSYDRVLYWGVVNVILALIGLCLRTILIVRPFETTNASKFAAMAPSQQGPGGFSTTYMPTNNGMGAPPAFGSFQPQFGSFGGPRI